MSEAYVHGYDARENERLQDQAGTLVDLLHADTAYPPREHGARGRLRRRRPDGHAGPAQPGRALHVDRRLGRLARRGGATDRRRPGSRTSSSARPTSSRCPSPPSPSTTSSSASCSSTSRGPSRRWRSSSALLRPGGTITVIEGDHGSAYFHPDSAAAHAAIRCQVELQRAAGGNALIGRQLYPLLVEAGFDAVRVSPRMVYVDASRPDLVDGFTRKTFTAMIEGVRDAGDRARA